MSQEMVAECKGAEGLVVAARIEGELAEQGAVVGDDADVSAGDQEGDRPVSVGSTERDVAQGHRAFQVGPVLADAEVPGRLRCGGVGLETGGGGDQRGASTEGAVRPVVVVVAAEGGELQLQMCQ
jgi:hypothetical protein